MSGRAKDFGRIAALASKTRAKSFRTSTISISAPSFPRKYRAIGWVGDRLYTLIFEVREDEEGEFYHFVTLWKATKQERRLYEEHS